MALAIFVLFYSLIALVDPYQQFGFNQFNRDSMPAERIEKAQLLEKNNNEYEFFIIGSSVANNFEPAIIEKLTGYKTFNFRIIRSNNNFIDGAQRINSGLTDRKRNRIAGAEGGSHD